MTFRNEVMDFVATYRTMNPAKTSHDRYYDMLRREQEKQDKIARDAVTAARKQRAQGQGQVQPGAPVNIVPTVASTNTPGLPTAPAQQVAMNTSWPEMAPIYQRGGPVKRFDGGGVLTREEDERGSEQAEADLIVQSLLQRDQADSDRQFLTKQHAAQAARQQAYDASLARSTADEAFRPGPAPRPSTAQRTPPDRRAPFADIQRPNVGETGGEPEVARPRPTRATPRIADPGADLPPITSDVLAGAGEQPGPTPAAPRVRPTRATPRIADPDADLPPITSDVVAGAGEQPTAIETTAPGAALPARVLAGAGEQPVEEERTSAAGRFLARPGALEHYNIGQEILRLEREKVNLQPSVFALTTPTERRQTAEQIAAIDSRIADLRKQQASMTGQTAEASPARPGVTANGPSAPAAPAPAPTPAPPVQRALTGDVDPDAVPKPTPYPTRASNGPRGGGGGTNGPSGGNSGPGSGSGAAQAPPAGALRTEDPRTRTAAFDPQRERINPDQTTAPRQFDAQNQLVVPTQQELAQMVATAAQPHMGNGQSKPLGTGAVSRPLVQQFVQQHNPTGELTDGQALLIGMHAKFKYLLSQGRAKEAAQMAWGLIQAANMEAASLGMVARDQIRAGDLAAGRQTLADAANWAVDGVSHRATANGIESTGVDGRVTQTPVDGRMALQMALALADGSATWQLLQSAASLLMPQDKGAEGRQLSNDLKRLQIEAAKRKLAGGGKGGGGSSSQLSELRQYLGAGTPSPPQRSSGGGSDDNWMFASPAGEDREGDNG